MAKSGSDAHNTLDVILIGKTGNGKSATGNTLLGETMFKEKASLKSVTKECQNFSKYRADFKCEVTAVDTPGLFDTESGAIAQTALDIQEALKICRKPNALLIILKLGRFTDEEKRTIDMLHIIFGPTFLKHAIIVFTGGSEIDSDEDFYETINEQEAVADLIERCNKRVVRIENNQKIDITFRETMMNGLFDMIKKISNNGSRCYNIEDDDLDMHKKCLEKRLNDGKDVASPDKQIMMMLNDLEKACNMRQLKAFGYGAAGVLVGAGAIVGGIAIAAPGSASAFSCDKGCGSKESTCEWCCYG